MVRFSRLDKFVCMLAKELERGKRKKFALKKLTTMNLPLEMYQRFGIGELASLFIPLEFCTDLCKILLGKIESKVENDQQEGSTNLSDDDDEPVFKKSKGMKKYVPDWMKLSAERVKKIKQQLKRGRQV
ncbi:hypothetical protein CAEBREN_02832 [Caenorhabditis brenneri]|uniref:Uncharacterized protein n=1 Tax=Caenorhabditis brenneri TaxID=135651 RepID=G0MPF3_CAEBE|nr:hypothetical protein CAEBREN_02832 [Caenorhabditis brenneri]